MRLQKESKDGAMNDDDEDDDDDDDEEEDEDKEAANSYERVISLRPAGVSLTLYLLQLISQSPKSSLSLAELSAITGLNVKRLSRRMYQLESQKILTSSIENRGRRFTKFFQLANGTVRKPSSIQSDSSKRTESTLQIERRKLILDAVILLELDDWLVETESCDADLRDPHASEVVPRFWIDGSEHSTEFLVDHKTIMAVLNFLQEKKLLHLYQIQTSNPLAEHGATIKKIQVVAELEYSVDSPEVKAAVSRYFGLQQEKLRLLKEDAQRSSLRECREPLTPVIVRLNALLMLLMSGFEREENAEKETLPLDPEQFLKSVSTQQLAALYGFVDQEALLLEPNREAPEVILSQWKALLLSDLESLRVAAEWSDELCRNCKSFGAIRAMASFCLAVSTFRA